MVVQNSAIRGRGDSGRGHRPAPSRAYHVVSITLATGETLPTLVRSLDWIPTRVPTRWAVRRRRFECMDNTLAGDLRGIANLYEWAAVTTQLELDQMLERSELPSGSQLESLIGFLRQKTNSKLGALNSLATVAGKAVSIRCFLLWVADPANQGSPKRKSIRRLAEEREMLVALFRPLERYASSSERIRPLRPEEVSQIDSLFGPVRNADGRIILPLRFHDNNPFRQETRLRNWLMVAISYQCGLRRGELLKIRLDDIPRSTDTGLKVRRRPHDLSDSRGNKPRVKTVERILASTAEINVGLRAYLTAPPPLGRPGSRSPYLFVTGMGAPLSISAADGIVKVIGRHTQINDLSWHSFRHTWAEGLADDLLTRYPDDQALQIIRELGGWKPCSAVPMHYIQDAWRKRSVEFMRERNSTLYLDPEA